MNLDQQKSSFKSGFVAILGRSNVGKSSIMNAFVGEKIAIVSDRPQTTRNKILGVLSRDDWQIVFVDTPGIHTPRTKLGEYMAKTTAQAREGVDAVLAVVDAQYIGHKDMEILKDIENMNCPKFLAVNKLDLVDDEKLMPQLARLNELKFDQIIPVSALKGDGMDDLLDMLQQSLQEGPKYFPDDMITDQPERVLCAEIIREKALHNLREEIPHGVGVEMLGMEKKSDSLTEIHATLYCEKASHKSIIIGKQGQMLKTIGMQARQDIERILGTKVMLQLWVKVREGWRDRVGDLRTLGYED